MNNLPGTSTYDCCWPLVYKERSKVSIDADLFVYVDNEQTIGPKEEVCWEASRKWVSTCLWLGIQDVSRKVQGTLQEPGPLEGTVTHTTEGVCGLVSQDCWDKVKMLIQILVNMEDKEEGDL